jgi:hypothetical protein
LAQSHVKPEKVKGSHPGGLPFITSGWRVFLINPNPELHLLGFRAISGVPMAALQEKFKCTFRVITDLGLFLVC